MHTDSRVEGHDFGLCRAMARARLSLGREDDGTEGSLATKLDSDPTGASLCSMAACEIGIRKDMQVAAGVRGIGPRPLAKAKTAFDIRKKTKQGLVMDDSPSMHIACQSNDRSEKVRTRHAGCI